MKKIACLVALLATTTISAQELWGGAQYGMTEEQVSSTSKGVNPIPNGDHLANGAIEKLRKGGIEIAQQKFTASYFFLDGKLDQVTLSADKGIAYNQASISADQIKDALTSKYGAPLRCKQQTGELMKGFSCNWAKSGGNVRLLLMGIGDADPIFNIVYQARLAIDAANL